MNWDATTIKCVVCDRRKQYGRKIQFFRFPHDSVKCRSWVKVIGKKELLTLTLDELHEKYVCESHFPSECINQNANRLHKVALPTLTTQLPPLDDDLLSDFLLTKDKTDLDPTMKNAKKYSRSNVLTSDKSSKIKRLNPAAVINYERPLMTCLETLIHNDNNYSKKPPSIHTISVPLLTYSSSKEKGTVFAAPAPENMPFVVPNFRPETRTITKPVNTISLNRDNFATYAKDVTLTRNDSESGSRIKAVKQYKRATIRPYKPVRPSGELPDPSLGDVSTQRAQTEHTNNSNKDTVPTEMTDVTNENEQPTTYTNTDLTFVPYTEYDVNVTPESADAHIGGGTMDYGLPLMNCIGTILNGNISTSAKCIENPDTIIDVPLMNCFRTLEDTDL